jgi:hAT family C-terminal dimerisation region
LRGVWLSQYEKNPIQLNYWLRSVADSNIEKPRTVRRSVFRAGAITDDDSIANYYRIQLFLPLLDGLISHLSVTYMTVLVHHKKNLLMGLVPAYIAKDLSILKPAVEMYADLLPSEYEAPGEFIVWQHKWQGHEMAAEINTAVAALQVCRGETLPNIKVLLQILATFPVTTAEPERVFSKLERTATAIRTPSLDSVLDKFAMTEARRLQMML